MNQKIFRYFLLIPFIWLVSCNSKSTNTSKTTSDSVLDLGEMDSSLLKKGVQIKLDYAILNLRNSDEFIQILSKQSDLYDDAVLNNVKKASEYESSIAKALNIGVYGADLNFIIHFNQIPVSFKYLLCAKQLSDQIGVSMAFDKNAVDKFNGNVDQKDTLINIVSSAYDVIKKYLRNGEQFKIASLVMTGSWIENMYLTVNLVDKCKNDIDKEQLLKGIIDQKTYLQNIISLLVLVNSDKEGMISELCSSLNEINSVFEKYKDSTINKAELTDLKTKVDKIRLIIVNTK